jgi:hypothetical protein
MTNPMIEAAARAIAAVPGYEEVLNEADGELLAQAAITAIEPMIRADERAQVEREIVEWLRDRKEMSAFYIDHVETAQAADAIEAGEYRK